MALKKAGWMVCRGFKEMLKGDNVPEIVHCEVLGLCHRVLRPRWWWCKNHVPKVVHCLCLGGGVAVVAAVFIDVLMSGVLTSSSCSGCPCLSNGPKGVCMYVYINIRIYTKKDVGFPVSPIVPSLQHLL